MAFTTEEMIEWQTRDYLKECMAVGATDMTLDKAREETLIWVRIVDEFHGWWDELIRDLAHQVAEQSEAGDNQEKVEVASWVVRDCLAVLNELAVNEPPERLLHNLFLDLTKSAAAELGFAEMGRRHADMNAIRAARESVSPSA